eukprot:15087193-Ditylum_brightwellii.AAC.1
MSIKIDIGDKVAVNTIIRMNAIKAAKLRLDLEDNVIAPGMFETAPLPVVYKQAGRALPQMDTIDKKSSAFLFSNEQER